MPLRLPLLPGSNPEARADRASKYRTSVPASRQKMVVGPCPASGPGPSTHLHLRCLRARPSRPGASAPRPQVHSRRRRLRGRPPPPSTAPLLRAVKPEKAVLRRPWLPAAPGPPGRASLTAPGGGRWHPADRGQGLGRRGDRGCDAGHGSLPWRRGALGSSCYARATSTFSSLASASAAAARPRRVFPAPVTASTIPCRMFLRHALRSSCCQRQSRVRSILATAREPTAWYERTT